MKPSKDEEEKLFKFLDEHKEDNAISSQADIDLLSHIMMHDLGSQETSKILHEAGFYDSLNVDCKLDYDKWIYVDKKDKTGAGKNSFHDVSYKLLYEMKQKYLKELSKKKDSF